MYTNVFLNIWFSHYEQLSSFQHCAAYIKVNYNKNQYKMASNQFNVKFDKLDSFLDLQRTIMGRIDILLQKYNFPEYVIEHVIITIVPFKIEWFNDFIDDSKDLGMHNNFLIVIVKYHLIILIMYLFQRILKVYNNLLTFLSKMGGGGRIHKGVL